MAAPSRASRSVVAIAGTLVVTAYAALLALDALVLDPLAAVPGRTLAQVYAQVDSVGADSRLDVAGVLVLAGTGVALAGFFAVAAVRGWVRLPVAVVCHLAVLACGAGAVFQSGFFLAMDVADAHGIPGGRHGPSTGVLYGTSLLALVAIPVVVAVTLLGDLVRHRRHRRPA